MKSLHFNVRRALLTLFVLMFFLYISSYAQEAERLPVVKDNLREQYSERDYQIFLEKERNGEIRDQGGPVYSPAAADALANNNTGASGTGNFTQSETSIIAFGNTILLGFNDSGSNAGGVNKFTGFSRSVDGGVTFTDGGTLPTNAGGDAGDPVIARNETTGRIYFSTLGFTVSTIQVFRSDDNGITWSAPVNGTPGGSSEDKQWIAVDNFPGAGNGNVYIISRRFGGTPGIYVFRSTDHGVTFTPNLGVAIVTGAPAMQGAFIAVGPDHSVYAFWLAGTTIQMRRSTDQGVTFAPPITVATVVAGGVNGDLGLTGIRNGTVTPAGFRSSKFPHAAVNPVSGHLYVTYNNDGAGVDKADVYVVSSANNGTTWGAPIKVNDDATTTDQWQPTIAVTPDGANIGIFYSSRQEDPANNNLFKYYGRTGTISGSTITFGPSFAISDVASLPEFGRDAVVNSVYMGDYNHAYATPGKFHVVWSDNRDDLTGGAGRKDPNVYYETINVTSPPPVGHFLVWEGVLGGQDYSGLYIKNFLEGLGYTVGYTSVFPASLTDYEGVFLSFGNYGANGTTSTVFNSTMAEAVRVYLEAGGKVYLEGGDAMEYDQASNTTLHSLFGLGPGTDGGTNTINGLQGQAGALTEGILFTSSSQVQNTFIDRYAPTTGTLAFVESDYGNVAVQYAGTYGQRTFCFSYALAGLNDDISDATKNELLTKILSFFSSPAQVPDISLSPGSFSFSVAPGGTDSDILNIANQGNAALNWNIYEESTTVKLRLPDGTEIPVYIEPNLEWKQPVKGETEPSFVPALPKISGEDVYSSSGGNYISSPALAGPECSGGIIYDDGTVENGYRASAVNEVRFVSKFTFPSYPFDLGKVCLTWTQIGTDASLNYNVVIYDDDGAGGTPGTLLATIPAVAAGVPAYPANAFYDVNVTGLVPAIASGNVYIGVSWNPTTESTYFLCADQTSTNMVHIGYRFTGTTWDPIQNIFFDYRAMFIRAERSSDNISWISENPLSGTVAAGANQNVTISVDAAGLTPGNYSCQLIISSNDPYDPQLSVPVTLEVTQSQFLVWEGVLGGQDYSGVFIKNFIQGLGYTVDYTNVFPSSMTGYDAVFLSFGNFGAGTSNTPFTTGMAGTVQSYLQAGGSVYLEGGDALEYDQATNVTLHDLFGIGDGADGSTNIIDGLQGQTGALTTGMLFNASTQTQNTWIDLYVPTTGSLAFVESAYGNVAVQYAGLAGQKTFCFSYALAYLTDASSPSTKEQLMTNIFNFLTGQALPPEINISPSSLTFTVAAGNSDTDQLTISNIGAGALNFLLDERNPSAALRLPDGREFPVTLEPQFEWKVPVKGEDYLPPAASLTTPNSVIKKFYSYQDAGNSIVIGDSIFGSEGVTKTFVKFDISTPQVLNSVLVHGADIYAGDFGTDLSFAYAVNSTTNQFIRINKTSGAITVVGPCAAPHPSELFTGMAVDLNTGIVYLTGTDIVTSWLYTVNTSTGALTQVGTITNAPAVIAIAIDNNGTMYAFEILNDVMLTINKTTAAGTVLGPIGFNANYAEGMDIDPESGILYLAAYNLGTGKAELRTGNKVTGNTTYIGDLGTTTPGGLVDVTWIGIPGQRYNAPWLSETPVSGTIAPTLNQVVDVTVNATGLTPGVYNCNLVVISNDADEAEITIPVTLNVTSGTVTANYNLAGGWNMIGLPLTVGNPNYLNLFPTAVPGTLYFFNGGYTSATDLEIKKGYWLKFPSAQNVNVQGTAVTGFPVTLTAGWNMIAGPYCNVPLASIIDPGGIIIPGTLYEFNGGYVNATSVNSAKGYWIKANAPGTITINCSTTLAKDGRELTLPAGITDPFTKIEISDAAEGHQTLYFNARMQSSVNMESFSLPPAAPSGTFDARLNGDYRLSEDAEVSVHLQAVSYPVNVTVTNLKPEDGYIYTLQEIAGGKVIEEHILAEGTSILLKNKDVSTLVISNRKDIPSSFELVQNYPNPFNPSTLIQYNLPEARNVSMIIYNSLGEKVKTLVSGLMEAGFYNVTWDGTNDYGVNVGSGTYIYAIRAGDFYSAKKMVLVK